MTWTFDPAAPTSDWTFASDDGRLALTLHPLAPETSDLELGAKTAKLTKAYGHFTGTAEVAGGRTLQIDVLGAAEQEDITW